MADITIYKRRNWSSGRSHGQHMSIACKARMTFLLQEISLLPQGEKLTAKQWLQSHETHLCGVLVNGNIA